MNNINWADAVAVKKYHSEFNKQWYQKNKEKRKKQLSEYGRTHRKEAVKRTQKYVARNKKKVREYNGLFNQTIEGKYRMLIYRAKHFGGTPITIEEFKILDSSPCSYCGDNGKVGIDRIDNSKGYTKENSTPACKLCNFMKKAMTVQDFLNHIKKIYQYNAK